MKNPNKRLPVFGWSFQSKQIFQFELFFPRVVASVRTESSGPDCSKPGGPISSYQSRDNNNTNTWLLTMIQVHE